MFDTLLKASGYMGLQLLSWSFYLFVLGIVTAPVMAAIAGCMARSRGLDTSRYAFAQDMTPVSHIYDTRPLPSRPLASYTIPNSGTRPGPRGAMAQLR